jgi:hypothetical protein
MVFLEDEFGLVLLLHLLRGNFLGGHFTARRNEER